ncbi:hypothetical protein BJ170DRAFT_166117 [Xylariales sp. AK1849]|nr:hypothetical protein BJ170DRAFT_166117 [Xylariales sp. AK1849]
MSAVPRDQSDTVYYVSPWTELNAGLWSLFATATIFLGIRLWCKISRRHGLWYDDYILIVSWSVLLANNILIVYQFATGYILKDTTETWDDRMHILINVSSCGTLLGQAWTKTAFGVTLLRLTNGWQQWILWFCIATMNIWMILKVILQWAKVCDKASYQNWYRLDFCIDSTFRDDFKEGGNVYNIIMDFIFASYPWLITRSLEMRRAEKIGLCVTLSLGMIVAIVSAIRISWKDDGNSHDEYYIWRNGISQVWYSSEITGTIIVQCIPILRTFLRETTTSSTLKKLGSTVESRSTALGSKLSTKRASNGVNDDLDTKRVDTIALREIPEEPEHMSKKGSSPLSSEAEHEIRTLPSPDQWSLSESQGSRAYDAQGGRSSDTERDGWSPSFTRWDVEQHAENGLSPPPQRRAQQ